MASVAFVNGRNTMHIVALLGGVLLILGLLGLLHVLAVGLTISLVLVIVGLVCLVFDGRQYLTR